MKRPSPPRSRVRVLPHDPLTLLALFGVGLAAGTLNVVAGGGSMLTLPVMIMLGMPATLANGTNRVAILIQNVGAVSSFHKKGLLSPSWIRLGAPPALVGSVLGTLLALRIGDAAFEKVLAIALVAAAAWTVWHPVKAPDEGTVRPPEGARRWMLIFGFFLVGFYGGFIQAGVGFVILALTSMGGLDLIRGNALKVALVLVFTPVALAIFAYGGKVEWVWGLSLAGGNLLGGLLGVHLQVLKGNAWVRNVVTVTIVIFALRLLFWS